MTLQEFLEGNDFTIEDCIEALGTDDDTLLEYVSDYSIQKYAEWDLDMIEESDCPECDCIDESDSDALWDALKRNNKYSDFPSWEFSYDVLYELGKLERSWGYFKVADKFEEFKNSF